MYKHSHNYELVFPDRDKLVNTSAQSGFKVYQDIFIAQIQPKNKKAEP